MDAWATQPIITPKIGVVLKKHIISDKIILIILISFLKQLTNAKLKIRYICVICGEKKIRGTNIIVLAPPTSVEKQAGLFVVKDETFESHS